MKIAVLTDSSAYLSKKLQKKYHIDVIPIPILWGKKEYKDLVDIGYEEFYQKLREEKDLPTTSQPAIGEVKTYLDRYVAQDYTDVIIIPLSSGISGFYNSLFELAQNEKRIKIHLFNSKITCAGEADYALLAARLVKAGASPDFIMSDLADLRKTMDVRFMVDDLNHLKRTGRLSNAASFVGGLLKIKPILSMDVQAKGQISAIAKERQYKRAYLHIQKDFRRLTENMPYPIQSTIFNALDNEKEQAWLADYRKKFPHVKFYSSIIGPVVGVHVGQHTMAMIWCRDIDSYFDQQGRPINNINSKEVED